MAARVGLTGGIGSGKSAVSSIFSELGRLVIDADQISREVSAPGTPCLNKISQRFGSDILFPDGSLNRRQLGRIVFTDSDQRQWLEALLHPQIRLLMGLRADQCKDSFCILEIPLLIESNQIKDMDQTIVVHCPREIRIQRIQSTRSLDRDTIESIMESQASDQQRLGAADHIIDNTGRLADLPPQVERLDALLTQQFSMPENPPNESTSS